MRERDWQEMVLTAARYLGWTCFHPYDSRRSEPGWPDAFCVKDGRALVFEFKTENGKVRPEQEMCLSLMNQVPGIRAALVRPSDWERVETLLKEAS